ncbi:cytochrome P450 [Mycena rebaudengoi]|nr:cytochrome P450 [Mycena rebaudengoi]
MPTTFFFTSAAFLACFGAVLAFRRLRRKSIESISGPPSFSWIYGNLPDILFPQNYGDHEFDWQRRYGPVYRIKGCFGANHLVVSDPLSLQYILHSSAFQRGPTWANMVYLLGEGSVMGKTGESHRRARVALNPAFSAGAVRKLVPVFERTAQMVCSLI